MAGTGNRFNGPQRFNAGILGIQMSYFRYQAWRDECRTFSGKARVQDMRGELHARRTHDIRGDQAVMPSVRAKAPPRTRCENAQHRLDTRNYMECPTIGSDDDVTAFELGIKSGEIATSDNNRFAVQF